MPPNTGTDEPGASADERAPLAAEQIPPPPERTGEEPPPEVQEPPAPVAEAPDSAPPAAPAPAAPRRFGPIPLDWRTAVVAAAAIGLSLLVMWAGTGYRYEPYVEMPAAPSAGRATAGDRDVKQRATRLRGRERQLLARLKATAPRGIYIVIDQTHNRLYLKKDDETLLEAVCSAGSGLVLKEGSGKKRQWVFDTPRGAFEVLSRSQKPVWNKPDWAFVEEGQPIPKNPADRLEYGSLGEYALNFGNGYMIHGTLYERLLGRAVTHGCIRVGRDDLRKVWAAAGLGTHIYIY